MAVVSPKRRFCKGNSNFFLTSLSGSCERPRACGWRATVSPASASRHRGRGSNRHHERASSPCRQPRTAPMASAVTSAELSLGFQRPCRGFVFANAGLCRLCRWPTARSCEVLFSSPAVPLLPGIVRHGQRGLEKTDWGLDGIEAVWSQPATVPVLMTTFALGRAVDGHPVSQAGSCKSP